jgi:hypothetical protein
MISRPSNIDTLPFRGLIQTRSRNRRNIPMRSSYMENQYSLTGRLIGPNKFAVDEEIVMNDNGRIQRKENHRIMSSPYSRRCRNPNRRVNFMSQPYPPMLTQTPSSSTSVLDRMPTPFDNVIRFEKPKPKHNNQSAKRKYKKRNKRHSINRKRKPKENEV